MTDRSIITDLDQEQLKQLIDCVDNDGDKLLLLKFSATWCRPCQTVAPLCSEAFLKMPDNVVIASVDIDESLDLYMTLKKKRMLTGIPCILSWHPLRSREKDRWYVPDDSVLSSSQPDHINFFNRVMAKAGSIKKA